MGWDCENQPGVTLTADIYWAHLPTELRVFRDLTNLKISDPVRMEKAQTFAKAGYKIDVPIMLWGWDPVCTMLVRKNQGFTWIPSALEPPVAVMPGVDFPGAPKYDPNNPSPAAIKVSIVKEDYPPFDPPVPVSPIKNAPIVGNQMGLGLWGVGLGGYSVTDGQTVSQDGKKFIAHRVRGLMGETIWFEERA